MTKLMKHPMNVLTAPIPSCTPSGREMIKQALLELVPLADGLGGTALLEAIGMCLAVLDAPGRLDKRALAPVLKLTHERVGDLFRQGIEETTGALQAKLVDGARQADEEAALMQKFLDELDPEAPN